MQTVWLTALLIMASGPEAGSLLSRGEEHLKQEQFQQALNDFSEILKTTPKDPEANLGRARALLGLGDGPKAVGPARMACELQPDNVRAWMVLGDAYAHEVDDTWAGA